MTEQPPSPDALLDFVVWRDQGDDEVWEMTDYKSQSDLALTNAFQITDLQHWLDLCA